MPAAAKSAETFATDTTNTPLNVIFLLVSMSSANTSFSLTYFFDDIFDDIVVSDIKANNNNNWKKMTYLHASICKSMRLYPPAPVEPKQATGDGDIWPDGTKVNKGTEVIIHIFTMGRSQELWGENWAEFKPERWLQKDVTTSNWVFISRDPFNYPVFQAGPRICLGIDIAFMQIKLVAANVLSQFQLVPAVDGYSPVYSSTFTSKMKNGFPVRVFRRV